MGHLLGAEKNNFFNSRYRRRHHGVIIAQNAIRRAPLISIPTPPSLHPLVTQTSSDMIGAALKQELS